MDYKIICKNIRKIIIYSICNASVLSDYFLDKSNDPRWNRTRMKVCYEKYSTE